VAVKVAPAMRVGLWSARDLTEGRRPTSCSGPNSPTGGVIARSPEPYPRVEPRRDEIGYQDHDDHAERVDEW